jgi:hypothetical protein
MRNEILAICLSLAALSAFAQTPSAPAAAASAPKLVESAGPGRPGRDQLTERITVDDGGARINELRVGGETRSITVQPKGGMPAYDVRPISGADTQNTSGARTWKILGF